MTTTYDTEYLSATETAKLIRKALKSEFPGVKFSVRSESYAGGASINISWTDGPTDKQVSAVTDNYAGGRFDGMIDMAYNVSHYLLPDGSALLAHNPGTGGQHGSDPGFESSLSVEDLPEGSRIVHFQADYVFTHREFSEEFLVQVEAKHVQENGTSTGERCDGCGNWSKEGSPQWYAPAPEVARGFFGCSPRHAAQRVAREVTA